LSRTLRATPTLLRVGLAEAFAYRAEFVVWMLTSTMPLVMLALWTSVAAEGGGAFGPFTSSAFVAYYLTTLMVRNLTGNWVLWQINDEIRRGLLSMRLLRPVHPFWTYGASHFSSVPLRVVVILPFALVLGLSSARAQLTGDPALIGLFCAAVLGAWILTFLVLAAIGCLCFFIEKSMSMFEIYMGVFGIFSGYLIPLPLLPGWVRQLAQWLPFRYMLAFPVETLNGWYDRGQALRLLGLQWCYIAAMTALALGLWRAGVRRFEAYGA
jgi:viologen exporter family transport system permease protein